MDSSSVEGMKCGGGYLVVGRRSLQFPCPGNDAACPHLVPPSLGSCNELKQYFCCSVMRNFIIKFTLSTTF